jgi:hypothetical protein
VAHPGMTIIYCPCSARVFWQALLSRARFSFRHASTTLSPSCIWARQNRETSRAQASCPCCWAEAADAIRTSGMTKRNRVILLCLTLINERYTGVLERFRAKWKPVRFKKPRQSKKLECPNWRRNAFVARERHADAVPKSTGALEHPRRIAASAATRLTARRPCGPARPDRGPARRGSRWRGSRAA